MGYICQRRKLLASHSFFLPPDADEKKKASVAKAGVHIDDEDEDGDDDVFHDAVTGLYTKKRILLIILR